MKIKPYITRTVKITCFLLAILFSVAFLQTYALRRLDNNSTRIRGFYQEPDESLDVVFIGASDIYTSFSSSYAYEKFGFTSYPYASESITADGTLTALKEALSKQDPKLIVIEVNAYLYGLSENEHHAAHLHKLLDNIPLNQNKIDYVSNFISSDEQIEYYLPLVKYHSMWNDYPSPVRMTVSTILQDLRGYSYLKGFRTTTEVFKAELPIYNDRVASESTSYALNADLDAKLRELLDYCKDNNLDNVVFVRSPHLVNKTTMNRFRRANGAGEIINSYGYDFINLERDVLKTGIDSETDFYNYDHMNIYGAIKFTDYLGNIIQNKYGVAPSKLSDKQKENWDESVEYFEKLRKYCDDLIKSGKVKKIEEDINTLNALGKY